MLIYLIAGEASGDALGASLMRGIKRLCPDATFAGIGGEGMGNEGLESLLPMQHLSVMGALEVIPHLPRLMRCLNETCTDIVRRVPDGLVCIDSPDFCFRVAKRIHAHNKQHPDARIALIHYVAPTVWAWRPKRAAAIARFLDHLLVLYPFEPPYFDRHGLSNTFVGHPVVHSGLDQGNEAAFCARHGLHVKGRQRVCLLPGSRKSEIKTLLPIFREVAQLLATRANPPECLLMVAPEVRVQVAEMVCDWPLPLCLVEESHEKADCFAATHVALASLGSISLELARAGVPFVGTYRIKPLSHWLLKRMVKIPRFCLVNIVLDGDYVPEYVQKECKASLLAAEVASLLDDADKCAAQRAAFARLITRLSADGQEAARAVLRVSKRA